MSRKHVNSMRVCLMILTSIQNSMDPWLNSFHLNPQYFLWPLIQTSEISYLHVTFSLTKLSHPLEFPNCGRVVWRTFLLNPISNIITVSEH